MFVSFQLRVLTPPQRDPEGEIIIIRGPCCQADESTASYKRSNVLQLLAAECDEDILPLVQQRRRTAPGDKRLHFNPNLKKLTLNTHQGHDFSLLS